MQERTSKSTELMNMSQTLKCPSRLAPLSMTLVELLMVLALSAILMAAIATAVSGAVNTFRTNQASLTGLSSARVAIDFLTSAIRRADECSAIGTPGSSTDTAFPFTAPEIAITFGGGAARSDCAAGDYLEIHVMVTDSGQLRVWQTSSGLHWNGVTYSGSSSSGYFDVPGVTAAAITYAGVGTQATSVQIQMTVDSSSGTASARTVLTGVATVRR